MTDSIPPADNPSNPQPPPHPRVIEVTAEVTQASTGSRVYEMPPSSSPPSGGPAGGVPPTAPPAAPIGAPSPPSSGRGWATMCHVAGLAGFCIPFLFIGLIATLVVWLIKKDEYPEVGWHGKESLNFQISLLLWTLASLVLCCCLIGIPLLLAIPVAQIVLMIYAAVRAANGDRWRYPLTLRLLT